MKINCAQEKIFKINLWFSLVKALLGFRHHHKKMESLGMSKQTSMSDVPKSRESKINGKCRWNDWSRRKEEALRVSRDPDHQSKG